MSSHRLLGNRYLRVESPFCLVGRHLSSYLNDSKTSFVVIELRHHCIEMLVFHVDYIFNLIYDIDVVSETDDLEVENTPCFRSNFEHFDKHHVFQSYNHSVISSVLGFQYTLDIVWYFVESVFVLILCPVRVEEASQADVKFSDDNEK